MKSSLASRLAIIVTLAGFSSVAFSAVEAKPTRATAKAAVPFAISIAVRLPTAMDSDFRISGKVTPLAAPSPGNKITQVQCFLSRVTSVPGRLEYWDAKEEKWTNRAAALYTKLHSTSSGVTWEISSTLPLYENLPNGPYSVRAVAHDTAKRQASAEKQFRVAVEEKPVVRINEPRSEPPLTGLTHVSGVAWDVRGESRKVKRVTISLSRPIEVGEPDKPPQDLYWDGSRWGKKKVSLPTYYSHSSGVWTAPTRQYRWPSQKEMPYDDYGYDLWAEVVDDKGRTGEHGTTIHIDRRPLVTIVSPGAAPSPWNTVTTRLNRISANVKSPAGSAFPLQKVSFILSRREGQDDPIKRLYWNGARWVPESKHLPQLRSVFNQRSGTWECATALPKGKDLPQGAYWDYGVECRAVNTAGDVGRIEAVFNVESRLPVIIEFPDHETTLDALKPLPEAEGFVRDSDGTTSLFNNDGIKANLARTVEGLPRQGWNGKQWIPLADKTKPPFLPAFYSPNGTWRLGRNFPRLNDLAAGQYTLEVQAVDRANSTGKESRTFVIDRGFRVTNTVPEDGGEMPYLREIKGTAKTARGGKDIAKVVILLQYQGKDENAWKYWNGESWTSQAVTLPVTHNPANGQWIYRAKVPGSSTGFPEGKYTLQTTAWDRQGFRKSEKVAFEVNRDPMVFVVEPTQAIIQKFDTLAALAGLQEGIAGRITEVEFTLIKLLPETQGQLYWQPSTSSWVKTKDKSTNLGATMKGDLWIYAPDPANKLPVDSNLADGDYAVEVVAVDSRGRTGRSSMGFHLDRTPQPAMEDE